MEKTNPDSPKRFKNSAQSLEWLRALSLRQWRHADPVLDPKRNIHTASEHIDKLLSQMGISGGLEEERLKQAWVKVAGDFVAKNTKPESLKNGVLVLSVLQPSMRFHLEQMKGKLLKNLRSELGEGVVKQVRFKVG
ncbi:Protein of unknown function [Rubritalea squalenifaciens DSM 18772]|uniref:DUF721 domain-containing protein n=2 Tax=Rubritalea TaxID=361050 RepID=A0A1M6I3M0_9BACT|nr:DUF721 domain-containing protein [Rubritalea squalenifaciens]SHJ29049.1 Protein of unknown function [Rubritalea squalenifaciens DSM 18772]